MDTGTIRTVMATINIKLKWHHLNRNNWHHPTEMAGTIRTVVSNNQLNRQIKVYVVSVGIPTISFIAFAHRQKPLHGSQKTIKKTDHILVISIKVYPNFELESLILSFDERVEVIEPRYIQDRITDRLLASTNNYSRP